MPISKNQITSLDELDDEVGLDELDTGESPFDDDLDEGGPETPLNLEAPANLTMHLPNDLWDVTGAFNYQVRATSAKEICDVVRWWKQDVVEVLRRMYADEIQASEEKRQAQRSYGNRGGYQQRGQGNREASEKQIKFIRSLCTQLNKDADRLIEKFNATTSAGAKKLIEALLQAKNQL